VGEVLFNENAEGATRPETLRQKDYWNGIIFRIDSGEKLLKFLSDSEKLENKAQPMKKRNVQ
jgi:hypothetical protein